MAMAMGLEHYSRQHVVDLLNRLGHQQLAEEAARDLPDPVDIERLENWYLQHGLSVDEMISQSGGSP
jgi:hypothetical protein